MLTKAMSRVALLPLMILITSVTGLGKSRETPQNPIIPLRPFHTENSIGSEIPGFCLIRATATATLHSNVTLARLILAKDRMIRPIRSESSRPIFG